MFMNEAAVEIKQQCKMNDRMILDLENNLALKKL